jgi:hypothetical protein
LAIFPDKSQPLARGDRFAIGKIASQWRAVAAIGLSVELESAGQSDGTAEQSDGTAVQSDGTAEQSDGTAEQSDGTAEQSDGTAVQSDGTAEQSDGTGRFHRRMIDTKAQVD